MASEALLYNALCSKPFAVFFCVCPAVSLVSFNFGPNLFLSRVLEKWEFCELVAKFWNPLRGIVLKLIMRGDAFIFSNLYQDSQFTTMGYVFMLLNSALTFTALVCSVPLELFFLPVRLLHCIPIRFDRVWWRYVDLNFSLFGLSYLLWFFVVLYERDSSLLGCYDVSTVEYLPTFRRGVLPLPLGSHSSFLLDCLTVRVKELSAHVW